MKKSLIPIFTQRKKKNATNIAIANDNCCAEQNCVNADVTIKNSSGLIGNDKKHNLSLDESLKNSPSNKNGTKAEMTCNESIGVSAEESVCRDIPVTRPISSSISFIADTENNTGEVPNGIVPNFNEESAINNIITTTSDLITAARSANEFGQKLSEAEITAINKLTLTESSSDELSNHSNSYIVKQRQEISMGNVTNGTQSSSSMEVATSRAAHSQVLCSVSSGAISDSSASVCASAVVSPPVLSGAKSKSRHNDPVTSGRSNRQHTHLSTNMSNSHTPHRGVTARQDEDTKVQVVATNRTLVTASSEKHTSSTAPTSLSLLKLHGQNKQQVRVKISDPVLAGRGAKAFLVFHVTTTSKLSKFPREQMVVQRSWRDFLSLHHKLAVKHEHRGIIVPPSPLHNTRGTFLEHDHSGLKLHMITKQEMDKIFRSLERFLYLIVRHPMLQQDADFVEFVDKEGHLVQDAVCALPPLTSCHLSLLKTHLHINLPAAAITCDDQHLIANAYMEDLHRQDEASLFIPLKSDYKWFQVQQHKYEHMTVLLGRLAKAGRDVSTNQKAYAATAVQLANSVTSLASCESDGGVAVLLLKMSDVLMAVSALRHALANVASIAFSDYFTDCQAMITAALRTFHARAAAFSAWQQTEKKLNEMRQRLALLEIEGHTSGITALETDIINVEELATSRWQDFTFMSTTLVSEVTQFDRCKLQEHRHCVTNYLEVTLLAQFEILSQWEMFHSLLVDLDMSEKVM